jgi:hypothetical protein
MIGNLIWFLVPFLGANVFARVRAGRTPREIAVEVRDDGNRVQEALKVSRGDIDLTIRLLVDAESKSVDLAAQEKGHKSAAEEPRSTVQSSNFSKQKKTLSSVTLGNALTGIYCCSIVPVVNILVTERPLNIWFFLHV